MKTKKMNSLLVSKNSDLKKSLSNVRGQLSKSEAKLGIANDTITRWKSKAAEAQIAVTEADARTENLQEEFDQLMAANAVDDPMSETGLEAASEVAPETQDESAVADTETSVPDSSWSLVQLRSESRTRGLTGISNKRKADVLAALRN